MSRLCLVVCFLLGFASVNAQTKKVLVEHFSSTVIPFDTDAEVILSPHRANARVIPVGLHITYGITDSMYHPFADSLKNRFTPFGFPTAMIDRGYDGSEVPISRTLWDAWITDQLKEPARVGIDISNSFTQKNRKLEVEIDLRFSQVLNGEYRLHVYLVEDSVTGSGSGYAQRNRYNSEVGHPFYQKGDPVVGFVHRNVFRYTFTGSGWQGLPRNIKTGTTYNWSGSYTIPKRFRYRQMSVVAFVCKRTASKLDKDGNEVLNADIKPVFKGCDIDFSYSLTNKQATFKNESKEPLDSLFWEFGDGSGSIIENPVYRYKNGGTYTVTLYGYDADRSLCGSLSKDVTIPYECDASFSYDNQGLTVDFEALNTIDVQKITWDFGDGSFSSLPTPSYTYNSAGTYTVKLTITTPDGSKCTSQQILKVKDFQCSPRFTFIDDGLQLSFTNNSTGDWKSLEWTFGDGNSSRNENPTYTYSKAGTYNVCLQLYDQDSDPCGAAKCEELKLTMVSALEQEEGKVLEIYPNPGSGIFHLSGLELEYGARLFVYNQLGQQVVLRPVNDEELLLDLTGLSQGAYVFRLIGLDGQLIKAGVLQKN